MTDPTPKPWWPPHAAGRHVQEPAPDLTPPSEAQRQAESALTELSIAYNLILDEAVEQRARADRAESNARGKQAVIEAQRATLDRVRAMADEAWEDGKHNPLFDAVDAERLRAILDAPQPEAGGDDE